MYFRRVAKPHRSVHHSLKSYRPVRRSLIPPMKHRFPILISPVVGAQEGPLRMTILGIHLLLCADVGNRQIESILIVPANNTRDYHSITRVGGNRLASPHDVSFNCDEYLGRSLHVCRRYFHPRRVGRARQMDNPAALLRISSSVSPTRGSTCDIETSAPFGRMFRCSAIPNSSLW